jgi:outer membrane protein OmpA-like peptidoglycan-associated protein
LKISFHRTTQFVLVSALALTLSSCADLASNNTDKTTVYFQTGKHNLSQDAKTSLNKFAASIQNDEVAGATVTGFADRRGSDKANAALSQRRANTVSAYLAGKGVASIKTAVVKAAGESQPTTACAEGVKGNAASACLSPDRRVEVTVDTKPRYIESGTNKALNHATLQDRHRLHLNK